MPYLLLAAGLLIAFYAFSRFFVGASPDEIKIMIRNISIAIVGLAIILLAITGRLGTGMIIMFMILPVWMKFFRNVSTVRRPKPAAPSSSSSMTAEEALDVLGLEKDAGPQEIQDAYKKLMQKVHPDNQGTDWMAAKLNQARDVLLN